MKRTILKLSITLSCLMVLSGFAQSVPELINYQGRVVDSSGAPLETGEYTLSVSIYDAETSGALLWGPQEWGAVSNGVGQSMESVPVMRGYFSLLLGPQDMNGVSLNQAFSQEDAWIEIVCEGVTNGRQRILSTPYSMRSGNGVLVGTIVPFGGSTNAISRGWKLCDGSALNGAEYPELFAAIGTAWGAASDDGNPDSDFRLPDLRGYFLRGVDHGVGHDPDATNRTNDVLGAALGDSVGSFQSDALQNVIGSIGDFNKYAAIKESSSSGPFYQSNTEGGTGIGSGQSDPYKRVEMNLSLVARTSSETRPQNVYVNYIIKY